VSRWFTDANWSLAEGMEQAAAEAGLSLPHLTLAWVMARPGITAAIVGASRLEQVVQNAAACEVKLSDGLMARVEALSATFAK
jgi:aryl-alcohol dehydrogenase-like predicted oxidoreductase